MFVRSFGCIPTSQQHNSLFVISLLSMLRDCLNREDFQVSVDIYLDSDKRSLIKQELFALSYFRSIYSYFHLVRIA
jgi:hypothetical protein